VKLTTHLQLVLGSRFHGVVLNYLSTGDNLRQILGYRSAIVVIMRRRISDRTQTPIQRIQRIISSGITWLKSDANHLLPAEVENRNKLTSTSPTCLRTVMPRHKDNFAVLLISFYLKRTLDRFLPRPSEFVIYNIVNVMQHNQCTLYTASVCSSFYKYPASNDDW
jgi:hypothetical protein